MANTLPNDSNGILYEGVRDAAGSEFVAKAAGTVTTDAGGVKSAPQLMASSDGALATIGTTTDTAYAGSGAASVVAALKGVYAKLAGLLTTKVVDAGGTNQLAVNASGEIGVSNFPATQAISAGALPLPAGAATEAGHLATIDTSTAAIDTNTAHLSPVAGAVALTTPPATTNAGADTALTFSSQVHHWLLQNNTSAVLTFDLDVAATAGAISLAPNATFFSDVPVTALHVYTAAAQNVNGSTVANVVLRGWL
jgi:hypothetical protein